MSQLVNSNGSEVSTESLIRDLNQRLKQNTPTPNGNWPCVLSQDNLNPVDQSGAPFVLNSATPIQRPYRLGTYGDSRSVATATITIIAITGSGQYLNPIRTPGWLAGTLADSEIVCNFGSSGELASGWASSTRPNSKTINNFLAANLFNGGKIDAAYVQYGINDYNAGATGATTAGYIQALCSALMSSGIKVILEATYPATAAVMAGGIGAPAKLQNLLDGNVLLKAWSAKFPTRIAYVDNTSLFVDGTGFLSSTYTADGTHFNTLGAKLSGETCAAAARAILPRKKGLIFTCGKFQQPNLIDWAAMASGTTLFTGNDAGTHTFSTPTWNYDAISGMPYAEVTATCATLNGSGVSIARFEVHASTVSGAGARYPLQVGNELQGSAYITVDNGVDGGVPPIQAVSLRHRLYSDSKFADDGANDSTPTANFTNTVARKFTTPTFVTATASAGISAPSAGAGYPLQTFVQFNAVGASARIRVYAPSIRVVNPGGQQPSQPVAGASPYTYTNTTGAPMTLYVAGGTVSQLDVLRQGTAFTTGLTSGGFRLAQGDSVTITYTVAPTLTVVPDESASK